MTRLRFHGFIAGAGSTSGVRVVVGHWPRTPFGPFSDAMVETADGHRVLLAPTEQVADFIAGTYRFDEVRIQPFSVSVSPQRWSVASPSLAATLTIGRRTPLGWALRAVPPSLAEQPAWCAFTDPVARLARSGVRTRGVAREGRREWYGATDTRAVTGVTGTFAGSPLGSLAPVHPAPSFGFSSTPRRPSVTSVVTTVET